MEKKIFLEGNGLMSNKSTRILYLIAGVIFILNGVSNIQRNEGVLFPILGVLLILAGLGYFFVVFIALNKNTRFMPRMEFCSDRILLKRKALSSTEEWMQENITRVHLDSYKIRFFSNKREDVFRYDTIPDISKKLKESLRAWCEERNIEVIGG